jgi:hypothetical protein
MMVVGFGRFERAEVKSLGAPAPARPEQASICMSTGEEVTRRAAAAIDGEAAMWQLLPVLLFTTDRATSSLFLKILQNNLMNDLEQSWSST